MHIGYRDLYAIIFVNTPNIHAYLHWEKIKAFVTRSRVKSIKSQQLLNFFLLFFFHSTSACSKQMLSKSTKVFFITFFLTVTVFYEWLNKKNERIYSHGLVLGIYSTCLYIHLHFLSFLFPCNIYLLMFTKRW